jgi:hypothetical protein
MKIPLAGNLATWTLLALSLTPIAQSQNCDEYISNHPAFKWSGLQPLILLSEYNPWAMVVGSDTPTFALYADGTVINWQGERRSGKYVSSHISPDQIEKLLTASDLDTPQRFKDCYAVENVTDLPTNVLVVRTEQGYKVITVYGVIRHVGGETPPNTIPSDLQKAFDTLLAFRTDDGQPWKPPYFEVIIWPFTYAKPESAWPANLPNLIDKNTIKGKGIYHLFIPISKLNEYESFAKKLKPTQAVLLDGKKWAISARFPFPHEAVPTQLQNTRP